MENVLTEINVLDDIRQDAELLSSVLEVNLESRSRKTEILEKRQVIMWKLCQQYDSYEQVGEALGFSRVGVRHSALKVEDLLSINDTAIIKLTNIVSEL